MAANIIVFVVLGAVLWASYRLLEGGSRWLNRRGIERERRSFLEVATRELGVEPLATRLPAQDDMILAARVRDTVVRVTAQDMADDFGTRRHWLVEIEDAAFDAPRAELPAMVEALRKTALLPEGFSLEPGKLWYTESALSAQRTINRIVALLALLEPAPQVESASAAPAVGPTQ